MMLYFFIRKEECHDVIIVVHMHYCNCNCMC